MGRPRRNCNFSYLAWGIVCEHLKLWAHTSKVNLSILLIILTSTVPRANSAAASFIIYIFFKKYYYYIVGFVDLLPLFCLNCPDWGVVFFPCHHIICCAIWIHAKREFKETSCNFNFSQRVLILRRRHGWVNSFYITCFISKRGWHIKAFSEND